VSFDNSRITFNPWNDYSGVVMEQGRVQTDADWNEWLAELARRIQAGTLDTMGQAVYPATTPYAFQIVPSTASGGSVTIGRGRMYVDGILVENHGLLANASWDPSLAELSGSPQPPPASDAAPVAYESQPYMMAEAFPTTAGDYLVYLDVWKQPITFIEDSNLIDAAIGVDTSGRLKTQWRVSTMGVATGATCASAAPQWPVSAGQLSNMPASSPPSGPCCLTTGSGYTGVENQFYRVEIHNPGSASGAGATFKWSRENASVQTTITAINLGTNTAGGAASVLTVTSLGRDQVLGFSAGNWVEITNQTNDDLCQPGTLYKIDSVTAANLTITLTTETSITLGSNTYTRLIRWDQAGTVETSANKPYTDLDSVETGPLDQGFYGIPVPTDGTELILENGIAVSFNLAPSTGSYLAMDYWNFCARAATGTFDPLTDAPPRGQHHHYAQLAIATVSSSGAVTGAVDCRTLWASSDTGECGCCTTASVGVGGTYSTIAAAIQALPDSGGEISILPGDYYENVVLSGRRNVVIRGCGWQTHVFSASLDPGASSSGSSSGAAPASPAESGLPAVFTIVDCENIELRSFSISADKGQIGILLDRSTASKKGAPREAGRAGTEIVFIEEGKGDTDVLLEKLILAASTLPAIVAVSVDELKIADNRIYMKDVASEWAAVYLSGEDMLFEHNWVGLGTATEFIPTPAAPVNALPLEGAKESSFTKAGYAKLQKAEKLLLKTAQKAAAKSAKTGEITLSTLTKLAQKAPGGIHVAGPSKNVFIVENEIVGGAGNGITLGNFIILDKTGADTRKLTGVRWEPEQMCSSGGTTQIPGSTGSGSTTTKIGAGGPLRNVNIDRNLIHQMGTAGIGVVGFWNLLETLEIISIENLSITANMIVRTMLRLMIDIDTSSSGYGYGAISLADVANLTIRDNIITDFGVTPGAGVCGIFVLHAEVVEISRNQIRETRDWSDETLARVAETSDTRVGIQLYMVTPPALEGSAWTNSEGELRIDEEDFGDDVRFREKPLYEPGLPALRLQENVVRVAVGLALKAFGYGPFSILGNHLSSGGPLGDKSIREYDLTFKAPSKESSKYKDPLLISIINLGLAIEDVDQGNGFAAMEASLDSDDGFDVARNLANASCGAVLFANNTCQLEALMSGVRGLASVSIMSLDDVLFNSNLLWLDGPPVTALFDGMVMGQTVIAGNNRFQECRDYPVLHSAATVGRANITSQNIASYCLKIEAPAIRRVDFPNVILWRYYCDGDRVKVVG
jgi:hypothetical protein